MIVLGIDPGSRRCGYAIVSREGGRVGRVSSGVLVPGEPSLPRRLAAIMDGLSVVLAEERVDAVAIETAYCGRSPRSALALGQARGVALAVAARAGLPVFEYAPSEVKRAFTGSGRADKAQMVRTARTIFGASPRLADEADAMAVAVCHLARGELRPARDRPSPSGRGTNAGATRPALLRPSVRRFGEAP
jgi:crossover junction endodeoxyribonuclease RuvC